MNLPHGARTGATVSRRSDQGGVGACRSNDEIDTYTIHGGDARVADELRARVRSVAAQVVLRRHAACTGKTKVDVDRAWLTEVSGHRRWWRRGRHRRGRRAERAVASEHQVATAAASAAAGVRDRESRLDVALLRPEEKLHSAAGLLVGQRGRICRIACHVLHVNARCRSSERPCGCVGIHRGADVVARPRPQWRLEVFIGRHCYLFESGAIWARVEVVDGHRCVRTSRQDDGIAESGTEVVHLLSKHVGS